MTPQKPPYRSVYGAKQRDVRAELIRLVGELDHSFESAVAIDYEFVAAYLDLTRIPGHTWILDEKTRALIMLSVTSSVTSLDRDGIRSSVQQAKMAGATRDEVLEAVHLCSVLGIHSYVIGVPMLADVAESQGQQLVDSEPITGRRAEIRDAFATQRGYWSPMNETLLRVDSEWFSAYTQYSSHPWLTGSISPKVRELIYIAIDLSCTHLFDTGLRPHIENAIKYGASIPEILEVFAVISTLGFASVRAAAPIIEEIFAQDAGPVLP